MTISRRAFTSRAGRLLLLSAVGPSLLMEGCDWVQFLVDYVPVINQGIETIRGYFGNFLPPPLDLLIPAVEALLLDISSAAVEYKNDPPASKATALGRIEQFLKGMVDNFQKVIDALSASGVVPGMILGIVSIVISTVQWLIGKFSTATTTRMLMPMEVRLIVPGKKLTATSFTADQIVYIKPIPRSVNTFKADINWLCDANGRADLEIH